MAMVGRVVTCEEEKHVGQSDCVDEESMRWVCVTEVRSSLGCRETLQKSGWGMLCHGVFHINAFIRNLHHEGIECKEKQI